MAHEAKGKRCLVTGGSGFVGSHLVDYLLDCNHKVTVIDFKVGNKPGVKYIKGLRSYDFSEVDQP